MTRVLHILDHSLPLHSGYTFRTRAILKAQQAAGLEVRGITGLRHEQSGPSPEEADGLVFHRTVFADPDLIPPSAPHAGAAPRCTPSSHG